MDASDLTAQGEPETVVLLPHGGALVGLHIKGGEDDARIDQHIMLGIREDERGQIVSCAITNELNIDTLHLQSGPRRVLDEGPKDYGEQ